MLDPDIIRQLQERQEELARVFIEESDPNAWPGSETREDRGDRYWYKRNAGATLTLVAKIQTVIDGALNPKATLPENEEDEEVDEEKLEREAMAEAEAILAQVGQRLKKKGRK